MVGELVYTMCGMHGASRGRFLELWAYPDGSLNLVTSDCSETDGTEQSFPCMIEQLERALDETRVVLRNQTHTLILFGMDDCVCGELLMSCGRRLWDHCMDREEFTDMLGALNGIAMGIL